MIAGNTWAERPARSRDYEEIPIRITQKSRSGSLSTMLRIDEWTIDE